MKTIDDLRVDILKGILPIFSKNMNENAPTENPYVSELRTPKCISAKTVVTILEDWIKEIVEVAS
jgi:hypothetical protein